ncbi:MAG: ATP-binding protein [Thiohalospira sp.]
MIEYKLNKNIVNFEISLLHSLPHLIIYINKNQVIEYTNADFDKFFNTNSNEIRGMPLNEVFSELELIHFNYALEKIVNIKQFCFVKSFSDSLKRQRHFKITVKPVLNTVKEILGYLFIYDDITDIINEKKEEKILNNHYKNYIENLFPGYFFYSYDKEGRFTFVSKNFEHISGFKISDVIGKKWFELFNWDKVSKNEGLQTMQKIFQTGNRSDKVTLKFWNANEELIYLQLYGTPRFNQFNNLIGVDGFGQDVTDTVNLHNELKKSNKKLKLTQNQLVQSEKMSSIGTLAAGIAHEINNPINFINAGLESLKKHYQKTIELIENEVENKSDDFKNSLKKQINSSHEMFDVIKQGVIQTQKIVQSLRHHSSEKQNSKEFFHLKEIIDLALLMIKGEKSAKIKITKKIGDIPLIYGYPTEITQLFSNLFLNAIQAVDEKGEIYIECIYHIFEKQLEIIVKDNGKGIPDNMKDKIFEPFFTTKDVDEGSGLGLYVCYNIIKKHKGTITVDSEEGKGTQFIISLPLNY